MKNPVSYYKFLLENCNYNIFKKKFNKLLKEDLNQPLEKSFLYSWLAPSGKFYPVEKYGHDDFAEEYLENKGKNVKNVNEDDLLRLMINLF